MIQFHETVYGHRFFDGQLPALIKNIGRVADVMEKEYEHRDESAAMSNDVKPPLHGLGDVVDVMMRHLANFWHATVLYSEGGSEGTWVRLYFKASTKEEVEEYLRHEHKHSVDFFVELVQYEIDQDFDMIDLTEDQ